MKNDKDFQLTAKKLREEGQRKLTLEEKQRRRRCFELGRAGVHGTFTPTGRLRRHALRDGGFTVKHRPVLQPGVQPLPRRVESAAARGHVFRVADKCLDILANSPSVTTLDITGGAPELQPEFRRIVRTMSGTAAGRRHHR